MAKYESERLLRHRFRKNPNFLNDSIEGCDLTGENYSDIFFNNVEIANSFLDQTDLSASKIDGLTVKTSNMREINFSGSTVLESGYYSNEMIRANFTRCELNRVKFYNSRCFSMDLTNTIISNSAFYQCEINRMKLHSSIVMKTNFDPGDKGEVAGFIKGSINGTAFIDCHFNKMYFGETVIKNSIFINCKFEDVEFYNTSCTEVEFVDCSISPVTELPPGINYIRIEDE